MNRVYVPYWKWEDWLSGMWRKIENNDEEKFLNLAVEFTGDYKRYGDAMGEVVEAWPNTMLNSLTNTSINRRAFLGHCACQYKINTPEYIVRKAWRLLTDDQRRDADMVAQYHIDKWQYEHETENRKLHKNMGEQMLF